MYVYVRVCEHVHARMCLCMCMCVCVTIKNDNQKIIKMLKIYILPCSSKKRTSKSSAKSIKINNKIN